MTPGAEGFFAEVENALPFGEAERAEILEELRAHVSDSMVELEGEGLSPDAAERVAVDRLGEPGRLARDLARARRSRRRLLAAAGAGSWAVVTSGIYGWVVGLLIAATAWFGSLAVVRFVGPFAFDSISFIAIGVALYVAGSVVTPVVAERAGYRAQAVRRVVTLAGALGLATYALVGWSGPLDAVGVAARLTLPLWWIAGTSRRSKVGRGSIRTIGGLLLVAFVVTVGVQFAQLQLRGLAAGAPGDVTWDGELNISRIAAPVPATIAAAITGNGHASISGSSGVAAGTFMVDVSDATVLAGWSDLRVEAWRAVEPSGVWPTPVSPDVAGPFAVAPAVWSPPSELPGGGLTWSSSVPWGPQAMTLSGSVRLDGTPWLTAAWVALTGVAPDGTRYLIAEPNYVEATFNGTALGWLEAAIREASRR
jgi:hypothetical protein